MYGRAYRPRSPERILGEIEYDILLFPNLKEIMFEDDTFTLERSHDRLEKICKGIIDRKFNISWACNARAEITNLSLLKLMKKSGCRMFCVGFESGDELMLERLKKGASIDKMRRFVELCRIAGISIHGCFVVGGPGETLATIKKTARFANSLPIDTVQFSGLCPYPGTEFYNWCKDNNFIASKDWKEWVDARGEQKAIVEYPGLSCEAINKAINRSLYSFYLRPGYIMSQILQPKPFYDVHVRIRAIFNFIEHLRAKEI